MLNEIGLSDGSDYAKSSFSGNNASDISCLLKEIYKVHLHVLSDCKGMRKQCTKLEKVKNVLLKRNRELQTANSELLEGQKALNEEITHLKASKVGIYQASNTATNDFPVTKDDSVVNRTANDIGLSKAVDHCHIYSKSAGTAEAARAVSVWNTQPVLNEYDHNFAIPDLFVPETVPLDFPADNDDSESQKQYVDIDKSHATGLQGSVKCSSNIAHVAKSPVFSCSNHFAVSVPVSGSPSLFDDEEDKRSLQRNVENTVAPRSTTVPKNCHEFMQSSFSLLRRNQCRSASVLTENDEVKNKCDVVDDQQTSLLQIGCNNSVLSLHDLSNSTAQHEDIEDGCDFNRVMKQDITGSCSAADVTNKSSGYHEPATKKRRDETCNSHILHHGVLETLSSAKNVDEYINRSNCNSDVEEERKMDDSFDRVANGNAINYRYTEVVRKQNLRRQMDGFACFQCQQWFHGLGLSDEEIAERLKHCRHKAQFEPAATPAHYWSVNFLTTQQCKQQAPVTEKVDKPSKCRRKKGLRQLFEGGKGTKNTTE